MREIRGQSIIDNPETLAALSKQDRGQINVRENRGQSRMDNPKTLATLRTQYTGEINVRDNRWDNQEWTNQRHWQH